MEFLIVAFAVFILVKGINTMRRRMEAAPPPKPAVPVEPPPPSREELLLIDIRDALLNRR
jgi:large conductance mechanosensitive channel